MLAILTRISRDNEDKVSIETQLESGIKLAKNLGINYKQYEERIVSSVASLDKRPMLMQLVKDIEDGIVSAVFVYDQTRLERSVETRTYLLNKFEKHKVKTYYNTGFVDSTSENKLFGTILSAFGEYNIELTSAKIKLALDYNTRNGKVHALSPYGYRKSKDKTYEINEEQAIYVRKIYQWSLEGVGINTIAKRLNELNVPTKYSLLKGTLTTTNKNNVLKPKTTRNKKDIKWSGGSVRRIITNPFYYGNRVFNGVSYEVPAILDKDYWQLINDNLKNNRNNSGKVVTHKYKLKGYLTCGKCGRNMYGRTRVSLKDNYYMCSSKRVLELNCGNRSINIIFLEALADYFIEHKQYEYIEENASYFIEQSDDINDSLEKNILQQSIIDTKLSNLKKSVENGIFDDNDLVNNVKELKTAKAKLVEEYKSIKNQLSPITNSIKDIIYNIIVEYNSTFKVYCITFKIKSNPKVFMQYIFTTTYKFKESYVTNNEALEENDVNLNIINIPNEYLINNKLK